MWSEYKIQDTSDVVDCWQVHMKTPAMRLVSANANQGWVVWNATGVSLDFGDYRKYQKDTRGVYPAAVLSSALLETTASRWLEDASANPEFKDRNAQFVQTPTKCWGLTVVLTVRRSCTRHDETTNINCTQNYNTLTEDHIPAAGTEWPLRRSTSMKYTEPEALSSPLYKSTRHLILPDHRFVYNREENSQLTSASLYHLSDTSHAVAWNTGTHTVQIALHHLPVCGSNPWIFSPAYNPGLYRPTPATISITALLGDLCEISADCGVPHSECVRGSCLCPEGYSETPDRQECLSQNFYPTSFHKGLSRIQV